MNRPLAERGAALAVAVAVAACGGDRPGAHGYATRDSAGVAIAENRGEAPRLVRLEEAPILQVGVAEGDPATEFSDVVGAALTDDGTLVVADGATREIRFFDREGALLRTFGRQGGGPGEFEALNSLAVRGDSIIARDMRSWRFTVVDPAGKLVGTTPSGSAAFVGLFSDGSLVSYDVLTRDMPPSGSVSRSRAALLLHPPAGGAGERIVEMELNERYVHTEIPGFSERIFGQSTGFVIGSDRIIIADNASWEVRVLAADGSLERILRRSLEPRLVSAADAERYIETALDGYGARREMLAPTLRDQPLPAVMPAFGRSGLFRTRLPTVVEGPGGAIWVLEYQAFPGDAPVWSVFDHDGRLVGAVEFAPGFDLTFVAESELVGVYRDALDVEHVRVVAFDGF